MTISFVNNVSFRNKTDLANHFNAKLNSSIEDAVEGLMVVFSNQIETEVASNSTIYRNHRGFNKSDAKVLTQIAKDITDGKELTTEQANEVRRRISKYTWQIMNTQIRNGVIQKQGGNYIKL